MTAAANGSTRESQQLRDIEQSLLLGVAGDMLAVPRFPQRIPLHRLHLRTRCEPVPSWCGQTPRSTPARTPCDCLGRPQIRRNVIA
jgi:hypothetical protein